MMNPLGLVLALTLEFSLILASSLTGLPTPVNNADVAQTFQLASSGPDAPILKRRWIRRSLYTHARIV